MLKSYHMPINVVEVSTNVLKFERYNILAQKRLTLKSLALRRYTVGSPKAPSEPEFVINNNNILVSRAD